VIQIVIDDDIIERALVIARIEGMYGEGRTRQEPVTERAQGSSGGRSRTGSL